MDLSTAVEVEYFDLSQNSYGTETIRRTEDVEEGYIYSAGYFIDETGFTVQSYPGVTLETVPVEW